MGLQSNILENSAPKNNRIAIAIALGVGLVLMIIKFLAYYITNSKAILTDATESIVNVAAASFAYYSVYLASRPKDRNHPYGHGKIEFFSSGLEGMMIVVAGLLMIAPAIYSFYQKTPVENLNKGIWLVMVTLVINGAVGYYLIETGKKTDSVILQADGRHLLLDALSSIALIAGLFLVKWTGKSYIDGILALLLAVIVIYNGIHLLRKSVGGLMDELDEETFNQLLEILNNNRRDCWIDVHNFRVQKYGADIHVDCHITLPYYLTLEEAHLEVQKFEETVRSNYPFEVEIFVHTDPCLPECCHYCLVSDCPVRKEAFTGKKSWNQTRILSNVKHFKE